MAKATAQQAGRKTTVRHGKLPRSSSLVNFCRGVLAFFVVVLLSTVSVTAYALLDLTSSVKTVSLHRTPTSQQVDAGAKALDGDINILLVGSDTRVGQSYDDGIRSELNDVTMLLRISADHKQATVVSFPRDLMLPVPSCPGPNGEPEYYSAMAQQQFNSTLQYGLGCVVRTVEELTGAKIPYAGIVTFDGVINMSNAVGGVDVCLAQPIRDPKADLNLPAGEVTLVGYQALQFLRTRHGVGDGGDKSRISNQHMFLSSLVRKIKSADTLLNPAKVYGLAKAAVENMQLSEEMASVDFMQSFMATVKNIDLQKVVFLQYPTVTHPENKYRLAPDRRNGKILMERLLADLPVHATKLGVSVQLAEGAADAGTAGGTGAGTGAGTGNSATDAGTGNAGGTQQGAPGAAGAQTAPTAPNTPDDPEIPMPDNLLGQDASQVTCSTGRTRY